MKSQLTSGHTSVVHPDTWKEQFAMPSNNSSQQMHEACTVWTSLTWCSKLVSYMNYYIFPAEALFCYRTFSLATFVSSVIQQGLQTGSWPQGQLSEYPITIHNHLLKRVRKSNREYNMPSRSLGMCSTAKCSNKATHLFCN